MENNKKNITPLSEKFDKAEMPFEPDAWAQMATLLADNPKKKGRFGRSSFLLFLAFFVGVTLLGSWFFAFKNNEPLKANTSFNSDKKQAVDATHPELYNSKTNEQNLIEKTEITTQNSSQKAEIVAQNSIEKGEVIAQNRTKKVEIIAQNLTEKAEIIAQNSIKKNEITTQNSIKEAEINTQNSIEKVEINIKNPNNSRPISNKTFNLNEKNSAIQTNKSTVFDVKNDVQIKPKSENEKIETQVPPQYFGSKNDISTTETSFATTSNSVENSSIDAVKNSNFIEIKPLNRLKLGDKTTSEFESDTARHNRLMSQLMPEPKPLWDGFKHELTIGYGNINSSKAFQMRYVKRLTPLLGLGICVVKTNESDYGIGLPTTSSFDLEAQFYIVRRRYFELAGTLGYGYNWVTNFEPNKDKTYTGFSFGIEPRFCLTNKWNLGIRFEGRYITPNILVQVGYRF